MRILDWNEENESLLFDVLSKRGEGADGDIYDTVLDIIADVRRDGDNALFSYTAKFDGFSLNEENILVTDAEIEDAYKNTDDAFIAVMKRAAENIRTFHEHQRRSGYIVTREDGTILGQRMIPMEKAGVYVPGGKAAYPSSVLMNILPAKVAGVDEIIMVTPPAKDGSIAPATLVAAHIAGADKIYRVGGAQAIAALAYGTKSIPKVDKITGPGNIYVALAKKACFGAVSIDSVAGPSEILVLADETANARFVAADLLSQAEHDEMASAVLVTTDKMLPALVLNEIEGFLPDLPRADIIRASLENYGFIIVCNTMEEALACVNRIASEHLEIVCANPHEIMPKIRNAGAIFLGEWSSEPLGDYYAGPNHILPTNGTARFFSPLSVDDFVKKTSLISYSRDALHAARHDIELFAEREGLHAHRNSIYVRFEGEEHE